MIPYRVVLGDDQQHPFYRGEDLDEAHRVARETSLTAFNRTNEIRQNGTLARYRNGELAPSARN